MSLWKFDPWSVSSRSSTRAFRAYCACPEAGIGTSGTIGTGSDTFPVVSHRAASVQMWLEKLAAAQAECNDALNRDYLDAAIALCNGPWLAQLLALDWSEAELFGVAQEKRRNVGLVQRLPDSTIIAATRTATYLAGCDGRSRHERQHGAGDGIRLVWETRHER